MPMKKRNSVKDLLSMYEGQIKQRKDKRINSQPRLSNRSKRSSHKDDSDENYVPTKRSSVKELVNMYETAIRTSVDNKEKEKRKERQRSLKKEI